MKGCGRSQGLYQKGMRVKEVIERQRLYDLTYLWNLKKPNSIQKGDWLLPEARDGVVAIGKSDLKVQTFSYKINKSWKYNVQLGDYS